MREFVVKHKIEALLLVVIIFSFVIRLHRLEFPESYYFDEVYFAFTAQEMAKGVKSAWQIPEIDAPKDLAYEWTHPPLGKEISAIGILIFGENTFGWRFFQAIFGALSTLFIFLLASNLFNNRVGIFAALLYSLESFLFVLSRITMVDIFMASFLLLGSLFVVHFAKTRKTIFLYLTGAFCGASISIKWNGVYIAEFLAAVSFFIMYYSEVYGSNSQGRLYLKSLFNIFPRMIIAFGLIPLTIYIVTYMPFFYFGNSIADFINLQKSMFAYHKGVTDSHPYFSPWWSWPLLMKGVYMHFQDLGGKHSYIYALGNPFIWWTGTFFLLLGAIQAIRKESWALIFSVVSAFAYWLPWALSPRKVTFLYHYIPTLLFVLIISAYFLDSLWNRSRYGKIIVALYLIIAAGVFFYFYPINSALPIEPGSIDKYYWLDSWR